MKKIYLSTILSIVLMAFTTGGFVSANENSEVIESDNGSFITNEDFTLLNPYYEIIDENNVIFFESEEAQIDYNNSKESLSRAGTDGYTTVPSKVSSTRETNHWVGYHSGTKAWAPASQYTLSKGTTWSVSGSYTYSGINVSTGFSYSVSVATTIPADSKRESRLGVWGDFTFTKNKYTEYRYGKPTGKAPTYAVVVTKHSHTIKPKYK